MNNFSDAQIHFGKVVYADFHAAVRSRRNAGLYWRYRWAGSEVFFIGFSHVQYPFRVNTSN